MSYQTSPEAEPFAIIGVSLKLPQEAVNEASLWEVLEARKNLATDWPENRASLDSFTHDGEPGRPNTVCFATCYSITLWYEPGNGY